MKKSKSIPLVIGVGGHVVAIERSTGEEKWRTRLKSASIVTILVDGPLVFAGAGGELFCLALATGEILWHNKLKGLGLSLVVLGANAEGAAKAQMDARAAAAAASA